MTEPTKEARVLAERYRVPDFISLAREIDAYVARRVAEAVERALDVLDDERVTGRAYDRIRALKEPRR
jgi:hypothetical protein